MSQQLQLFPNPVVSEDCVNLEATLDASDVLVQETRLLFDHHGSNDELIHRILETVEVLNSLGEKTQETAA
jgi:hypothetical protein